MSKSIQIQFVFSMMILLSSTLLLLSVTSTFAQITFSKDWRAGGKRAAYNPNGIFYQNDGVDLYERPNHCEQIFSNLILIKQMIEKETNELLKCQKNFKAINDPNNNNGSNNQDPSADH